MNNLLFKISIVVIFMVLVSATFFCNNILNNINDNTVTPADINNSVNFDTSLSIKRSVMNLTRTTSEEIKWQNTKSIGKEIVITAPLKFTTCDISPDGGSGWDTCYAYLEVKNNLKDVSALESQFEAIWKNGNVRNVKYEYTKNIISTDKTDTPIKTVDKLDDSAPLILYGETIGIKITFEKPRWTTASFDFDVTLAGLKETLDPEIDACGTLSNDGATYTLNQSVSSSGTCFTIDANNITLDGNGYWINYSDTSDGYGITASSKTNVTIKNANIMQINESGTTDIIGIRFISVNDSFITNVNSTIISGTSSYGIFLSLALNNTLTSNTLTSNTSHGIHLETSSNNNLTSNIFNTNSTSITIGDIALTDSNNTNVFNLNDYSKPRKITFFDNLSQYNMSDNTVVYVSTQTIILPTASRTVNRTLVNWNQSNVSFSENWSEATTAQYNISGLLPLTNYQVWNDTTMDYSYITNADGILTSFTINFTGVTKTLKVLQVSAINIYQPVSVSDFVSVLKDNQTIILTIKAVDLSTGINVSIFTAYLDTNPLGVNTTTGEVIFHVSVNAIYTVNVVAPKYTALSKDIVVVKEDKLEIFMLDLSTIPSSIEYTTPHFVKFIFRSIAGQKYENTSVNIYNGSLLFSTGVTGTDGSVVFKLIQNVEYRLHIVNTVYGFNKNYTIFPTDFEYTFVPIMYNTALINGFVYTLSLSSSGMNFIWNDVNNESLSVNITITNSSVINSYPQYYSLVTLDDITDTANYIVQLNNSTYTIPTTMWNVMNHSGNDSYFTDNNVSVTFNFWTEYINSNTDYKIWVKVPISGTGSFKWHYGRGTDLALSFPMTTQNNSRQVSWISDPFANGTQKTIYTMWNYNTSSKTGDYTYSFLNSSDTYKINITIPTVSHGTLLIVKVFNVAGYNIPFQNIPDLILIGASMGILMLFGMLFGYNYTSMGALVISGLALLLSAIGLFKLSITGQAVLGVAVFISIISVLRGRN